MDEITQARFDAAMQKAADAMRIRVVIDGNENAPHFTTLARFADDNGFSQPEMHALLNRLNVDKLVDGGGGAAVAYRITIDSSPVLRVGDMVLWRGGWGADAPKLAKVTFIEIDCEHAEGTAVNEVPWRQVNSRSVCVDLDGPWAYGFQIDPAPETVRVAP